MLSVYEIIELEKKWERYNAKKKSVKNKKYIIISSILALVLIALIATIFISNKKEIKAIPNNNKVVKKDIEELKEKARQAKLKLADTKKTEILETNKSENLPTSNEKKDEIEVGVLNFSDIEPKKRTATYEPPKPIQIDFDEPKEVKSTQNKGKILIKSSEVKLSIDDLKDKFEKTQDLSYALEISKEYFNKKQYQNAIKWALVVNNLDTDNEESWIIFAKSKYRINQKQDAIKVLEVYNKSKQSKAIDELLEQIKGDKL